MKPPFINRALFILPMKNQYGVLDHFTLKLAEAMGRKEVECKVMPSQGAESEGLIRELVTNPPDFTCTFNGLLPDDKGEFLADRLEIPHLALLVDSAHHFLQLAKSHYTLLGCDDADNARFFKGLGAAHSFFCPHAVDKRLFSDVDNQREIPVLMLGSNIDFETVRETWQQKLPEALAKVADLAAEIALSDGDTPISQAVVQALQVVKGSESLQQDPHARLHSLELIEFVEQYVRGKDRHDLVCAVKDAPVAIYGGVYQGKGWSKYFGHNHPNVEVHPGVSFDEGIHLMRRSKIVLNSCPRIKNGAHERVFAAIACGALPLTHDNRYMRQAFTEGHDIAFYQHHRKDEVNDMVMHYLQNEDNRCAVVRAAQENVARHHTWDVRASEILEELRVAVPLLGDI